jgi:hypothetical protein
MYAIGGGTVEILREVIGTRLVKAQRDATSLMATGKG